MTDTSPSPVPLLIDCDPGRDDAIALLLACVSPAEIDLQVVTTVAGNVPAERTAANALRVLEFAGRAEVPVYAGCPRPLLRDPVTAEHVHGDDGLAGAELPPPATALREEHAVAEIIRRLRQAPAPVTVAALAPLTNLACALTMAPDIVEHIDSLLVMGGALGEGNMTPWAEYNFHVDPHAAAIVLGCGAPLTLVPLDVTTQVVPDDARLAALAAGGRGGALLARMWRVHRDGIHDACVIARMLAPGLFEGGIHRISLLTADDDFSGQSLEEPAGTPVAVLTGIDVEGFYALLDERLRRLG